jgi:hypothetical protein
MLGNYGRKAVNAAASSHARTFARCYPQRQFVSSPLVSSTVEDWQPIPSRLSIIELQQSEPETSVYRSFFDKSMNYTSIRAQRSLPVYKMEISTTMPFMSSNGHERAAQIHETDIAAEKSDKIHMLGSNRAADAVIVKNFLTSSKMQLLVGVGLQTKEHVRDRMNTYYCMNRNARRGKRANKGKRPCSRNCRRKRRRRFGSHRR